jgi:hypothetical protein
LLGTIAGDYKPLLATHGTRRQARYATPSAVYNAIRNRAFSDLVRSILNNKETQTFGDLECSILNNKETQTLGYLECSISTIWRQSDLECSISAITRHKLLVTLRAA